MTRDEYWDRVLRARNDIPSPAEEERLEMERRLKLARVPRNYWDASLEMIPDQLEYKRQVYSWLDKYLDRLRGGTEAFPGLYLYGPLGSGKTGLAAAVMKRLFSHKVPGVWLNYSEIVDVAANDPANVDGTSEGLWSYAQHARIAVVDDVLRGGVTNNYSALQLRRVEELLRNRWNLGRATILTGNFALSVLREHDVDSLASVIEESTYDLAVKGANFRGWKAKHKEPL